MILYFVTVVSPVDYIFVILYLPGPAKLTCQISRSQIFANLASRSFTPRRRSPSSSVRS